MRVGGDEQVGQVQIRVDERSPSVLPFHLSTLEPMKADGGGTARTPDLLPLFLRHEKGSGPATEYDCWEEWGLLLSLPRKRKSKG